jgi:hypothetical protein
VPAGLARQEALFCVGKGHGKNTKTSAKVEVKKMAASRQVPGELSVGQLAARSGVSVPALHFYESEAWTCSRTC